MYKKIYLEITNGCNLNCDFCIKNKRKIHNISIDEYMVIIDKIKNYTQNEISLENNELRTE